VSDAWEYTLAYMKSGRTNPDPDSFVNHLNSLRLTANQRGELISGVHAVFSTNQISKSIHV
jgi:hypothetical protein